MNKKQEESEESSSSDSDYDESAYHTQTVKDDGFEIVAADKGINTKNEH